MSKDITHLIERLELFEERLGIRLEGLYAQISDDCRWVTVTGEVHALEGMKLNQNIKIVGAVYDNSRACSCHEILGGLCSRSSMVLKYSYCP
jgi:hypothetical protein